MLSNIKFISTASNQNLTEDEKNNAKNNIGVPTQLSDLSDGDNVAHISDIPTSLSELSDDSNHRTVTDAQISQISINKDNIDTLKGEGDGSILSMIDSRINTWASQLTEDGVVNTYAEAISWIATHASDYTNLLGEVSNKVDKISGKGLSTNDLTSALKSNYDTAYNHSQSPHARTDATKVETSSINGNIKINDVESKVYEHPGLGTNPHGTTKSDIGLSNVDNKSSETIRNEITYDNVVGALGYIPSEHDTKYLEGNGIEFIDPSDTEHDTSINAKLGEGLLFDDNNSISIDKDFIINTSGVPMTLLEGAGIKLNSSADSYTVLSYIESTGEQCIDTDIITTGERSHKFDIKYMMTQPENTPDEVLVCIGNRTILDSQIYAVWEWGSKFQISLALGNGSSWTVYKEKPYSSGAIITDTVTFEPYSLASSVVGQAGHSQGLINSDIKLFGCDKGDGTRRWFSHSKLWYIKYYDDDVLTHHFVPVIRDSDSCVGLLDIIEKRFYTNTYSQVPFTAGILTGDKIVYTNDSNPINITICNTGILNVKESSVKNQFIIETMDGETPINILTDIQLVTTSQNGLMSSSDKSKLDGISEGATAVLESTVAGWGFTKNTGDYNKPSTGIPKSDLSSDIQSSLDKADSALQQHQSLSDYAKKTDIPTIPTNVSAFTNDMGYITEDQYKGTYNKPSGGIPKSDLASDVQASLGKADTALQSYTEKYTGTVTQIKVGSTSYNPSSGVVNIPAYPTTLPASDVYSWAKASTKPTYTASEVGAASTAVATTSSNGLMSASDKTKLNNIDRGNRWTTGVYITGTSTTPTVFSNTGITDAIVGDMYLNSSTYNLYQCTTAGNASTARWKYICNIKGATGSTGISSGSWQIVLA